MMNGSERRSEERSDCAIAAKIELSDRLAITVTVVELSVSGVRLQTAESIHLPDEFDLFVPVIEDVEQRYRVKVAWRRGDMIGGEFVPADWGRQRRRRRHGTGDRERPDETKALMVANASHTFEVIAVRRGEELTRVTVVATDADAALEEGRWLLAEEATVNLFDFEISFLVDRLS